MFIDLIAIIGYVISMGTTTISVSDEIRRELLRVAAQLQAKIGEKVDYDQVIHHLLSQAGRNEQLLKEACRPTAVSGPELRKDLRRWRAVDQKREKALEVKYA
jgi:hypothetical protein